MKKTIIGILLLTMNIAHAGKNITSDEIIVSKTGKVVTLKNNQTVNTGYAIDYGSQQGSVPVYVGCQKKESTDAYGRPIQQQELFGSHIIGKLLQPNETATIRGSVFNCTL